MFKTIRKRKKIRVINNIYFQELFFLLLMESQYNKKMLYVQHWSFKTGYHQKGAEKFLGGGGDYPGVEMIGRYHAPGSLEGWIVLKTDDPKAIYQHAAEWGEFLNWETTPVFTDEEAGQIVAKVYS